MCNLAEVVNRVPAKTNWQCLFPRSVGHFGSIFVCRTLPANGEPRVWLVLPHACEEQRGREGGGGETKWPGMLSGYPAGSEKPVAEKSPTLERKYQHHGELLWELLLRQRRWDRLPANLTLKEDRASRYDYLTKFYRLEGILHPKMNIQASFTHLCVVPNLYCITFFLTWKPKEEILLVDIFLSWVGTEAYKLCEGCKSTIKVTHTKPCDSLYEQTGISLFTDDGTFLKFLKVWKTYEQEFICIPHVLARLTLLFLGCVGCLKIIVVFF